jgi:hypothetical protein
MVITHLTEQTQHLHYKYQKAVFILVKKKVAVGLKLPAKLNTVS